VIILPRAARRAAAQASAAVLPQRGAQEANLLLEASAGVTQEQVQANSSPLPEGNVPVLHLRDQTARVLARDQ